MASLVTLTLQSSSEGAADSVSFNENQFNEVYTGCQGGAAALLTVQRNGSSSSPSYTSQVRQIGVYDGAAKGTVTMNHNYVDQASFPDPSAATSGLMQILHFSTLTAQNNTFKNVQSPTTHTNLTLLGQQATTLSSAPSLSPATALIHMADVTAITM